MSDDVTAMLLQNRNALVTGAGRGLGATLAAGLAAHGARVICTDIDAAAAQQTADRIVASGGKAAAFELDVTHVNGGAKVGHSAA